LASFWRFSIPTTSLPWGSLDTVLSPHAPRPHAPPAGSGRARTLPRWRVPDTDRRIEKDGTRPNLDQRALYLIMRRTRRFLARSRGAASLFYYVTEPGDSCGKINPFPPARRRRTVDHSLLAGTAQLRLLQACLPDGHTAQCLFSACSP